MTNGLRIKRFHTDDTKLWNNFVATSKNGTFLHDRNYLNYHSDRFSDHSLIVTYKDKPVALLPANQSGKILQSHGGLTYGGFVTGKAMSADLMCDIFSELKDYLKSHDMDRLFYKSIPHIFHKYPAEEDLYALSVHGASTVSVDLASVIDINHGPGLSKSKKHGARKASASGLLVCETHDFTQFWDILTNRLKQAHQAAPTHSLDEIHILKQRFPRNILLFQAFDGQAIVGGIVVFDCENTLHAQYMATTETGRDLGALDLIMAHIAEAEFAGRRWFSFGISTTDGGKTLNAGLCRQKEMFGARSVVFTKYELPVV
ncbi:GNAT family N-acetyltransferase [Roseinatronobacter sp. NSM]|uniref:GNAT family N-acetyltransferase n=1 Tax=Roseinatronobacter sp. NSM TaxID=3457785 RepID=UPI004036D353